MSNVGDWNKWDFGNKKVGFFFPHHLCLDLLVGDKLQRDKRTNFR